MGSSVLNACYLKYDIHLQKKKRLIVEILVNTVWASTFLALILTVPSLVIFMGIYFFTGNIVHDALVGFGLHFVGLVYSEDF